MEAGRVIEVGTPAELVMRPDGHFRALVEETGETNAAAIKAIALKGAASASLPSTTPVSILSPASSNANVDKVAFTAAPPNEK